MTTPDVKTKLPNPVLMAAQKNQPSIVSAILSHRISPQIDVNERDNANCSALGYLAQKSNGTDALLAVEALIASGASVDTHEPDFQTRPEWNEARTAHVYPKVSLSLLAIRQPFGAWKPIFEKLGLDRLKMLSSEFPLLHEALKRQTRVASELLLAAGADVNREDEKLGLPIACCSTAADFAMLVAAGAKLNVIDSKGRPALQLISSSNVSSEILSMAAAAAQAEAKGQVASFKEGKQTITKASDEIAQPLIEALFNAIANKNIKRVECLWKTLNLGRDKTRLIEARDKNGQNLLHCSLAVRNFGLSRRLLKHGLSPNVFDNAGVTPFSILLGLSHERSERDRYGTKREKIFMELLDKVDWTARTPFGISYYETLLCVSVERLNGVSGETVFGKALATRPDWLELSATTTTCSLSRVLAHAVKERRSPSNSILECQESRTPMHVLLKEQIARPEFGEPQARAILQAALSTPQNDSLQYIYGWLLKTIDVIESNLDVFKATGIDPDDIAWAPALATSRPTLFASIESWRISGTSLSVSAPRARPRSL